MKGMSVMLGDSMARVVRIYDDNGKRSAYV